MIKYKTTHCIKKIKCGKKQSVEVNNTAVLHKQRVL